MPNIKISVSLELGAEYQIIIRVSGKVFHFEESRDETVQLESNRVYVATIAGFQDPTNADSTVKVLFKQGTSILGSAEIKDRKFITKLLITTN